ncbi:hypothetical protein [Halobacterium rubrum]|uniref:hypothetical protein n=1 Tax=Halobacterium TaxID=2239 RepID=UPI001F42CED4|nr:MULTISPECIES: hypothetical protein [Halobacterium]MDH5021528.1 hypothetical protein [Halobacterium rubrum]
MNDTTKIGVAGVLLLASAALLLWSSLTPTATTTLLVAAGLATTGLAAGSLIMGSTGVDGRMV